MEQKLTKKEIREMWFEALESGNYRQGTSRLNGSDRTPNTYCCLGVLADLCIKHNLLPNCSWEIYHDGIMFNYDDKFNSYTHLPEDLLKLVGIEDFNIQSTIVYANDAHKFTFKNARDYMLNCFAHQKIKAA